MISMFFIQLIFLAAGALLAAVLRNPKGGGFPGYRGCCSSDIFWPESPICTTA